MSTILEELVAAAEELVAAGLVTGAGGNVSCREGDSMWVSPSGFSFADARPEHYPRISVETGEVVEGDFRTGKRPAKRTRAAQRQRTAGKTPPRRGINLRKVIPYIASNFRRYAHNDCQIR